MTFEDVKRIRENPTAEDVDNQELHKLIDIALEKQIPKKPKDDGWLYCPNCGKDVLMDKFTYCPDCGQLIDWSDTE